MKINIQKTKAIAVDKAPQAKVLFCENKRVKSQGIYMLGSNKNKMQDEKLI